MPSSNKHFPNRKERYNLVLQNKVLNCNKYDAINWTYCIKGYWEEIANIIHQ